MVDSGIGSETREGPGTSDEMDWAVINSLIQAQDYTSRALQAYLLRTRYREGPAPENAAQHIEEAIERHRKIIEDLSLARDCVEEIGGDPDE